MKAIVMLKVERKPGWVGWIWLWGRARVGVMRKNKRMWFRVPLGREVYMPKHVKQVGFGSLREQIPLRIVYHRGKSPHA
jgi:hypothetical protein